MNTHVVHLSPAGTGSADLVPGLYGVGVEHILGRRSLSGGFSPRKGGTFRVASTGLEGVVEVVTERPRRLTFELMASVPRELPGSWVLRNASNGFSGTFQGRSCELWTEEGALDWEILSEKRAMLSSVRVPRGPGSWSGHVWIK